MTVRTSTYSLKPTGLNTATMKSGPKEPLDTQDTQGAKRSFVVHTTPSIVAVKTFIQVLFGLLSFDEPAQPRFPAPQQKGPSTSDTPFTLTDTERAHEAAFIALTLVSIFMSFDSAFVGGFTQPAQPPAPPLPPSRRLDTKPAPHQATEASSNLSWGHLPSRAGREASGIPSFGKTTAPDAAIRQAPTAIEPIELHEPTAPAEPPQITAAEPFTQAEAVVTDTRERPVDVTEVHTQDAPIANAPLSRPLAEYEHALTHPDPVADHNHALAQYAHALAHTPVIPEPLPADSALQRNMVNRLKAHTQAADDQLHEARQRANEAQHCRLEAQQAADEAKRLQAWADYNNAQAQGRRADDDKQADQAEELRQNAGRQADAARDFNKRAQHFNEEAARHEVAATELQEMALERKRMAADLADQIEMHGGTAA